MPAQEQVPEQQPASSAIWAFLIRFKPYLTSLAIIAVFALTAFAIYHLTSEVRYDEVETALLSTSWTSILLAILFTGLSFVALICYDVNAIDYIGKKLPLPTVAITAFSAYAIGNTAGFGALSGGAIRFRAYSRLGLNPGEIGRIIAFVTLSFGLGLLAVTALSLLMVAPRVASIVGLDPLWLRVGAVVVVGVMVALFVVARGERTVSIGRLRLRLPDTRTASRQFLVSALDIAATATALYVLLPDTHVGWPSFFAIFATAVGLGVLSHVPAGLGVFETVMIAGLGNAIDIDTLLGSLVLYRIIYHVLPLLLATVLLVASEIRQLAAKPLFADIGQITVRLAPSLLSTLALIVGAMLIFSSVTPTPDDNLDFLSSILPLPIVEAAHFLSSILGLGLVVASRGIGQRLDGAWWVGIIAASAALVLSLLKAVAVFEAMFLGVFIAVMLLSAGEFTRHASLLRMRMGPAWLSAIAILIAGAATILFFVYRDTQYSHALWWEFEFSEEAPRSLRALLGLVLASSALAIFSLLRPVTYRPDEMGGADLEKAIAIAEKQDMADANLVRMADKHIMFSQDGNAFIMYGIQGRSWIGLTDPIGEESEMSELVWQFVETARAAGGRAAFYQVSPKLLSYCADAGLRAFKLGELAIVDLETFELKGSRLSGLRQALNRGTRDGLAFSLLTPDEAKSVLGNLRDISDAWLAHHNTREKTFSLGSFSDEYVLSQPVAVLHKDDKIVAFATVMVTDTKQEATVDLMRFLPEAPRGAMDFLFISIMEQMRSEGYRTFNLGMAPLSGMSKRDIAPVWDWIGGTLFEHGEKFYNFKGLRAFKTKFHPKWEPRYLAVSNGAGAALALMDVTLLIGGGVRGVVGK
jgi:phosphatidylglycerol lysyltransferase